MKYLPKRWTLAYYGLGFMGSFVEGQIVVDAATIQQARAKATQQLTIYLNIFSIGSKIKYKTIEKKDINF